MKTASKVQRNSSFTINLQAILLIVFLFTDAKGSTRLKRDEETSLPTEFTQTLLEKRTENERLMGIYYGCLTENNGRTGRYLKTPEPVEAHLVLAGDDVTLPCGLCLRPQRDYSWYQLYWTRSLMYERVVREVNMDHERFVLTEEGGLLIREVTSDDAGEYACFSARENQHYYTYQVDVVANEVMTPVAGPEMEGTPPAENLTLPENNIVLYTTWSSWSRCSECGRRGHWRKIGICTLNKIDADEATRPVDMDHLSMYVYSGVPCRSTLLVPEIAQLPEVALRRSEVMEAYCFFPCPTVAPVTNYYDDYGNLVDVVNTGDGYVSVHDGELPTFPPLVTRQTIYAEVDKMLRMECPHEHVGDVSIRWQNNTDVIDPLRLHQSSRGRVLVNTKEELVVLKLKYSDSAPYSCWINGVHIATISVEVVDGAGLDQNIRDYIILAGFALSLLVAVSLVCHVLRMRKRKSLV